MDTGASGKKIIVFSGQTISGRSVAETFGADARRLELRPPAGLGDVWQNIRADVPAMVVIDCIQRYGPSLWHREIRSALEAGIAVFGAGGIGALRAAELNGLGMTGVGKVFEQLQNGRIEADDEVLSGPDGFALVTLRLALEKAIKDELIMPGEAENLLEKSRGLFFEQRSRDQVLQMLQVCVAPARREKAAGFIESWNEDPRVADAIDAVGRALYKGPHRGVRAGQPDDKNPAALMLRPKWRLSEIYHRCFKAGESVISGAAVLERARALRDAWQYRLKSDFFVRRWLKEQEIEAPGEFIEDYTARAMADQENDATGFLLANGMTFAEWKRLLEKESIVQWAKQEKEKLLPGFSGNDDCFAEAWAAAHGVSAPSDSGLSAGQWVIEKSPLFFGLLWEEPVAFMDALRLSGQAAQFAAAADKAEYDDV